MEESESTSTMEPAVDAPASGYSPQSPESVNFAAELPEPADADPGLVPLTPEEIEGLHQRILQLPQASRRALTAAFREHFAVPRSARSIGDRITQRRHGAFIERFLEELEAA